MTEGEKIVHRAKWLSPQALANEIDVAIEVGRSDLMAACIAAFEAALVCGLPLATRKKVKANLEELRKLCLKH